MLAILCLGGITLLGYMIAINAHGAVRISISYLIATVLLVATVFVVVQHVDQKLRMEAAMKQEAQAALAAYAKPATPPPAPDTTVEVDKKKTEAGARISAFIADGKAILQSVVGADMRDPNLDYNSLVARASDASARANQFRQRIEVMEVDLALFPSCVPLIQQAASHLSSSCSYCRGYFHAENSDDESARYRQMLNEARTASDFFQQADIQLSTGLK